MGFFANYKAKRAAKRAKNVYELELNEWEKMYSLKKELTVNDLEKKGEKFRPYRSVVAWYCWRALN